MKKIMTWVCIAAILGVDGLMQDQNDTTVTLLGENMDAIEKKLKDDATALAAAATHTATIAQLTSRAETAEAALVNAAASKKTAEDSLAALQTKFDTQAAELTAANLKLSKRPANDPVMPSNGPGTDTKIKANEMKFQQDLFAALQEFGTTPKKPTA